MALQKKALVEPRMPQLYVPISARLCFLIVAQERADRWYSPTRRVRKTKEYEKHAWKNFE